MIQTTEIPFNRHLDIKKCEGNSEFVLYMDAKANHMNHLETIHASAIFSLAEASSGEFLHVNFDSIRKDVIPVIRKAEVRFRKPVKGRIRSKAELIGKTKEEVMDELEARKRALLKVKADIYDEADSKVFSSVFEWFIAMASQKIKKT